MLSRAPITMTASSNFVVKRTVDTILLCIHVSLTARCSEVSKFTCTEYICLISRKSFVSTALHARVFALTRCEAMVETGRDSAAYSARLSAFLGLLRQSRKSLEYFSNDNQSLY